MIIYILRRAIISGTPLLLSTTGEIFTERTGVLNLGVEGIMALGAVSAFGVTLKTGNPWLGFLAASLSGVFLSLIHGFVCITLKANQTISGLAITMFGLGLSGIFGKSYTGLPLKTRFEDFQIPLVSEIPVIGEVLFYQNPLVYISIILSFIMWFILFKTRWGIHFRSVGENPMASEAMGINVNRTRYIGVIIGGIFSGIAGAYLSLAYMPSWIEGMTAGRGWIAIALTVFSIWNPLRALLGAYLFGGIYVLQYFLQGRGISPNILLMLPYIGTLFVLFISLQGTLRRRLGAPSALGVPYIKGEK